MHSPPRAVAVSRIARCFSNWKSPSSKGSSADARDVQINKNMSFAELCKALLIAERRAREEVEMCSKKEKEKKEEELAHKDTQQRAGGATVLAAERSAADVQINNNKSFAELCKALLIAERRAREELEMRSKKGQEKGLAMGAERWAPSTDLHMPSMEDFEREEKSSYF